MNSLMRFAGLLALCVLLWTNGDAHPLGVFTTNRFARIEPGADSVNILYVIDIAEIPAMQAMIRLDANHDGSVSATEDSAWAACEIPTLVHNLSLTIDGAVSAFHGRSHALTLADGQAGLKTIRMEMQLVAFAGTAGSSHELGFTDRNFMEGRGWKEIVVMPPPGVTILRSSVPPEDLSNALRSYPSERQANPPAVTDAIVVYSQERPAHPPTSGHVDSGRVSRVVDTFASLVTVRELTPPVILISLLIAFLLGAGHALTPGHGKTIVAAYLIGARGTARHAAFLGLTVTVTHTLGVFALGLVALVASEYVLPETLFPWLSLVSGLLVAGIGVSLLRSRWHNAAEHVHGNQHDEGKHPHRVHAHTHMPPGTDGTPVSLRSLLALGVSGGLLPCPSAIVVLLGAVAMGRIGFGLVLIVAFSLGLAGVLTGIGVLMIHARQFLSRFSAASRAFRWLPVISAGVVTIIGVVLSIQALVETGACAPSSTLAGGVSALLLGFVLGLRHALDPDHLVAVSTLVSGRQGVLGSSVVGALWGLGHTASLLIVGVAVIAFHLEIPEQVAQGMEFLVAIMLVVLGVKVLVDFCRGRITHTHRHRHGSEDHVHPHIHPAEEQHHQSSGHHHRHPLMFLRRVFDQAASARRSIVIGMVHGLAGSAALMLLVLTTIPSRMLGLAYIGVFGAGSVGGMILMSLVLGVPFAITANRSDLLHRRIRVASGIVSVAFGVFYALQVGMAGGAVQ